MILVCGRDSDLVSYNSYSFGTDPFEISDYALVKRHFMNE